ncbi:hypothetical protein [Enhygromyxa salina]|uniref:Uncharacterized protein n=1 Tax=Enhygromyxa salina TaxID=215803 RepID=A0A2S9YYF4_9BACT|nr:hypothetical protein [Enhygromyxa salina]PRQ10121.1 hypothetical protein ENSA7_01660 [Enhygromyxa salina]
MTSFPPEVSVHSFWAWFETVAPILAQNFENPQIHEELDRQVSRLGGMTWELGPGHAAQNALTLTPDGDPDLLRATKHIVALAPSIPNWEFHPAKPPKEWALTFSLETEGETVVDVDANRWRYVLLRFPDSTFDILLRQDGTELHDDDDRYVAAIIVLDGLLGEEARMSLVGSIELVDAFSAEELARVTPISELPHHLMSLLNRKAPP